MAFKFNIAKGVRVRDDLFSKLVQARNERLHGEITFVECAEGKFTVHTRDGKVTEMKAYGEAGDQSSIRLCNMLNAEIQAEPERRKTYKEQAEKSKPQPTPRAERFAKNPPVKGNFARW